MLDFLLGVLAGGFAVWYFKPKIQDLIANLVVRYWEK